MEKGGIPKKRKLNASGKGQSEQPPKAKVVKVEVGSKTMENTDDSGDSGDA